MSNRIAHLLVLAAFAATCPVQAATVGSPQTSLAIGKARLAFVYESYDRDIEVSNAELSGSGPLGQVNLPVKDDTTSQEEDRFMARLSYAATDRVALQLDGGVTDANDAENLAPLIGAGIQILAYESDTIDASLFGSAHYVSGIEYRDTYFGSSRARTVFKQDLSYWEANGGLSLSRTIDLDKGATLTPYGGVMISMLNGDEDLSLSVPNLNVSEGGSADVEDDGVVSLFGGFDFAFNDRFGVQFEGRFVNQSSISAALTMDL